MSKITTVGLDLAKSVFQVHGNDRGCGDNLHYPQFHNSNRAVTDKLTLIVSTFYHTHARTPD